MQDYIGSRAGKYEDSYEAIGLFEKNGKTYMMDMLSTDCELSIKDLQKITKTIKNK